MPMRLLRHNAGTIAIIASVHDAFRADVERPSACERAVELAVILLLQRGFQRWRIWNRLQHFPMFILHARVGVRTDPVVPIDLQGGHLAAGRNLPADDAPLGILFLAAAGFVQAFDACRMTGPKGPEDAVKIMAAPIAQGAGAEVPIIAPVGRVQARVVVAEAAGPSHSSQCRPEGGGHAGGRPPAPPLTNPFQLCVSTTSPMAPVQRYSQSRR